MRRLPKPTPTSGSVNEQNPDTSSLSPRVVTLGVLPERLPRGKIFVVRFRYRGRRDFDRDFLIVAAAKYLCMTLRDSHTLVTRSWRGTFWWDYSTREPDVAEYVVKAVARIKGVTASVRLDEAEKP